jgi:hypothetical protein
MRALEIMDIISNHAFALTKRAGKWERIDSAERKKLEPACEIARRVSALC